MVNVWPTLDKSFNRREVHQGLRGGAAWIARLAHNEKVVSSNLTPATKIYGNEIRLRHYSCIAMSVRRLTLPANLTEHVPQRRRYLQATSRLALSTLFRVVEKLWYSPKKHNAAFTRYNPKTFSSGFRFRGLLIGVMRTRCNESMAYVL